MRNLSIFGLEFGNTIVTFEISALKFVWLPIFVQKWKILNTGTEIPHLGIHGLEIRKNHCHLWNQHPQICHNGYFNLYNKFWNRFRFCKGPEFTFSEGSGLDLGPLYKVCSGWSLKNWVQSICFNSAAATAFFHARVYFRCLRWFTEC